MKRKEQVKKEALDLVNKLREAVGEKSLLKLIPGIREKANSCPLARSIPGVITIDLIFIRFNNKAAAVAAASLFESDDHFDTFTLKTPGKFERFIELFDSGEYPELEN